MTKSGFFKVEDDEMMFSDVKLGVELEEYLRDLIEYGLGRYEIDFGGAESNGPFRLWGQYKKEQVQQLLLKNPADIMKGTKIVDGITYAFVTVIKGKAIKDNLNYDDGYIDKKTFQWETVSGIGKAELDRLKHCEEMQVFVRKVENEDGITLPFAYLGKEVCITLQDQKKTEHIYSELRWIMKFRMMCSSTSNFLRQYRLY